jgi:HSP20 family protein
MPKKDKEGNGAHAPAQTTGQNLPATTGERSRLPALRTENPFSWFRDEMDTLFNRYFGRGLAMPEMRGFFDKGWDVNVQEGDNEIVVRAEAPGFEPKEFEIHVRGDTLTIRAEHKEEAKQEDEGYRRWEQRYGRFERAIPLSTAVDPNRVEARYRNGILEVHLPRTEPSPRKRIEVKA